MKVQNITIDAATGAISLPAGGIRARHDTTLHLRLAFSAAAIVGPIAGYTAESLRLGVKEIGSPNATTSLLGVGTWEITGSDTATRYELEVLVDSDDLRTSLGTELQKTYLAQFAWAVSTDDNEVKSQVFEITIENSVSRSSDIAPDITDAGAWAWLKARIQAGLGLSRAINDGAQTLTLAATGGLFGRVTTDLSAFHASDLSVFTVALEANTTYRLQVSPIFYIPVTGGDKSVKLWGTLPSGAAAHGRWLSSTQSSDQEYTGQTEFTDTSANKVFWALGSFVEQEYMTPLQSFIIVTSGTAGNMVIKARSNNALVRINAGTHYVLTKLA